jgi:hypothetical protein
VPQEFNNYLIKLCFLTGFDALRQASGLAALHSGDVLQVARDAGMRDAWSHRRALQGIIRACPTRT